MTNSLTDNYKGVFDGRIGFGVRPALLIVDFINAYITEGAPLYAPVVGSPTRGFRPTEAVMELLNRIPPKALKGIRGAAFDTRFKADELDTAGLRFIVKTGGYAAKRIADRLKKAGGDLVAPPEGFYVEDTEGPLKPGELERASRWAASLLDTH